MALYTTLDAAAFSQLSDAYGLGPVRESTGIPQGSINSNFRLVTASGRYFVRHTTVRSAADLRFEADLLALLNESHVPAPRLVSTREGQPFLEMEGGRVSIFTWLPGEELTRAQLTPEHLEGLGMELGKLHRVTLSFGGSRTNPYGPEVVRGWLDGLRQHPDAELSAIAVELQGYLARAEQERGGLDPRGVIHADLFMDNVKWLGDRVSALFDFEMACRDAYGLDVAITLNAWCFDNGAYRPELCRALLRGYQVERSLVPVEREDLFGHALFGAVRYTASRIRDFHLSGLPPDKLAPKDFRTYLARARALAQMGAGGLRALAGV
ncbi:homoserine kinase [Archangium sp.]|jgi:homoserine kinase type II|uniref:homoserine kinase n=1 Tax=Archangium sp. TaxID=1872627 RepID=UPI002EDB468A